MSTNCSTCRFFFKDEEFEEGVCRRHAPTRDGFPFVLPGEWCGDYEARPPKCFREMDVNKEQP